MCYHYSGRSNPVEEIGFSGSFCESNLAEARFENYLISYLCKINYGKSLAERGSVLH